MKTAIAMLAGLLGTMGWAGAPAAQSLMCLAGPTLAHDDARRVDHLARSRELEASGDLPGAIAEARRAAFDRGGRVEYGLLVRLAEKAGDEALAVQALGALADALPEDAEPLVQLARKFVDAGDSGAAAEAAAEAAERNPRSAEAWHLKGRAELQRGRLAEAVAAFEQTVRLNPRHAWAFNNLGYARLLARQPEKAVEALERARQLAPHLAYIHNNLGVAYEELGRLDDAQLAYGKALDLEPRHPSAAASFARTAEALGWAGPSVEGRPDAGWAADGGETGDWAEEFEPATVAERSWLFEADVRSGGDEPSGADLRDDVRPSPLGVSAGAGADRD